MRFCFLLILCFSNWLLAETFSPSLEKKPASRDISDPNEFFERKKAEAPKLKGITFIPREEEMDYCHTLVNGIVVKTLIIPKKKQFMYEMEEFLGQPITPALLQKIKTKVTNYYWEKGYPLVKVIVPAGQDVTDGKLQIIIMSSKLGAVKIEGDRKTSDERIKKEVSIKPGEEIRSDVLLEDTTWLEYDPFRSVDIIYEPGEKLGTTDIVLHVKEAFPFRAYGGYENYPYKAAGSSRVKAGFNWGHLFLRDQQLNFEITTARKFDRWFAVSGNYIIPLPWRNSLKFFYNYSRSRSTAEELNIIPGSATVGKLWQVGVRYDLFLKRIKAYSHLLQFGYDFKRSNDLLEYYGDNVSKSYADISQFILRYEGALQTSKTQSTLGMSAYFSPGNMSAFNTNEYFNDQRAGADALYGYMVLNFDHYHQLPGNATWAFNAIWQMSTGKLLATEEFSLGGHLTVRGYLENEVLGDIGFLLKNELRSPSIKVIKPAKDDLQFLVFIDFGVLTDVDKNVLSRDSSILLSSGPGIRYKLRQYIDIRFDMGFQLKSVHGELFGKDVHYRGNFSAFLTF